jgi:hypothetical protein
LNHLGQRLAVFHSQVAAPQDRHDPQLGARFVCDVEPVLLRPGRYHLNVWIRGGGERQDFLQSAAFFDVVPGLLDGRSIEPTREVISVCMPHRWILPKVSH